MVQGYCSRGSTGQPQEGTCRWAPHVGFRGRAEPPGSAELALPAMARCGEGEAEMGHGAGRLDDDEGRLGDGDGLERGGSEAWLQDLGMMTKTAVR
ncbi:hypothetical protein E2562_017806 [Oryza meyeriana var. granulata]|uniref:Uncharacterized protein n=1 Tax=Oryza meyeriana var. granulata TaxID=110450 RepID=A0A6G1BLZ2_9ORYZ|nr:hypothetical protein E2562_017806 [Oryza meyeriana var. granulata]